MRRKMTEAIEEWDRSGRRKALLISGCHHVGKTYVVDEYCRSRYRRYLKVDFSTDADAREAFEGNLTVDEIVLRLSGLYMGFEFIPGETVIFLDEIQLCPNARTALKHFAIDGRYRVIASGSLLGLKIKDVALPPTGYVEHLKLGPMDFEEFLWAIGIGQPVIDAVKASVSKCEPIDPILFESLSKYYRWYLVVGGMPEAVRTFVDEKQMGPVRRVQEEILAGYTEDIGKYASGSVATKAEDCLRSIPLMLAEDSKKFRFSKVVSVESGEIMIEEPLMTSCPDAVDAGTQEEPENDGLRRYYRGFRHFEPGLTWLSMADITLTCRALGDTSMPLEEHQKLNSFKLYLLDTGLLLAFYGRGLVGRILAGDVHVNKGAIAENAVAVALSLQGRRLMYYGNTKTRTELDFLTVVDGRVCALEVKSGEDRRCPSLNRVMSERGLSGIMFETRNCFEDDKGVRHYPLFAASFMDAIDPRDDREFDFGDVEALNGIYGERSERPPRTLPGERC